MVAFLEQENLTQHGISIPPQSCLQCRRRPVTSRVIYPPRARKYHAILEYSRIAWSSLPSFDIMPGYTASNNRTVHASKKTTNLREKFYGKTALNGEIPVNKYQNNINHMS